LPLKNYYLAEDFHQDYLEKNPNGYCHININDLDQIEIKPEQYKRPTDAVLQKVLSDQQLQVTLHVKTEKAFDNAYYNTFEPGIYVDISTGEPLFVSNDKYEANTGCPTFSVPISPEVITLKKEGTENGEEVRSRVGDIHLGQLFNNGPKEQSGKRYSINSAALRFIPIDEMKQGGYGHLVNIIR
jgi:peptide methionine sulfoxide reductase msrA/msrB